MFVLSFATLALVVSSSALVIPRSSNSSSNSSDNSIGINCQKDAPQGWLTSILESYEEYHSRYLALDCEGQHNTSFFQSCCHPHLKTQLLSDSPPECIPSAQAVAAVCNATTTSTESAVTSTEVATTTESTTRTTSTSTESTSTFTESTTPTTSTTLTTTTHSSTHQPASSSTQKPTSSATPIKSASSSLASSVASAVQVFTGGIATFFFQNGVAGACGAVHSDQDLIAAIDQDRYGNSGEKSSLCGQQVIITNTNNGKTVTVTIVDDCPTCVSANSIDLSLGAFEQIGTQEEGEVPIKWSFVN